VCWSSRMGLGRMTRNFTHSHKPTQNQQTSWLAQVGTTLVLGRTTGDLGFTRLTTTRIRGSHHLPSYSILCTSPQEWHPNDFLSRDSQVEVPKLLKLGLSQLYKFITSCANFRLGWGLNRSSSLRRELSNSVLHATCTQGNWVDSWLSVVGSQIVSSTPDLSFDHNLCCKCPNESYELILDI
jgi:hypothetical protein